MHLRAGETNATAERLEHAAQLPRVAVDHRAASQALRDPENRACFGVSEQERGESPFEHREDIASVDRLSSPPQGKGGMRRFKGALVVFRAVAVAIRRDDAATVGKIWRRAEGLRPR